MDIYKIYADASWSSNIKTRYGGAYIVYLNGVKIEEVSYIRQCRDNFYSEFNNMNKALIDVYLKYNKDNKKQKFIFISDCDGCIGMCNKILRKMSWQKKYEFGKHKVEVSLLQSIKRYNNIEFKWISREFNSDADNLAKAKYNQYISQRGRCNPQEYVLIDLEYTAEKWKSLFASNKNMQKYINKLESLILDIQGGDEYDKSKMGEF